MHLYKHRMTVVSYAVQHPGNLTDRRCIQSTRLHLARLYMQLEYPAPPTETNAVMLDFARHKASLIALSPPPAFRMTAADVVAFSGTKAHSDKVMEWANKTWEDWSDHQELD